MGIGVRFIVQTVIATIITMTLIFAVKKMAVKYDIPVIKTIAEGV